MCFTSNKYSNSFSQRSFKLFVQLIDTDSVYEIVNTVVIWFASEHYSNIKGHKDIVIGGSCSYWELVCHILLCDQELNLGPRKTEDKTSFFLDLAILSMSSDNSISSFGNIDPWSA